MEHSHEGRGLKLTVGTDRGTNVEQNAVEHQGKPWITKHLNIERQRRDTVCLGS
jgi:hypothetical protein